MNLRTKLIMKDPIGLGHKVALVIKEYDQDHLMS